MRKPAKQGTKGKGFTAAERAAMKERVQELRGKGSGETAVLARIEGMSEPDRTTGKRIHDVVMASAPQLSPKLWYGMPAYARDGKVVCFFQAAGKFKTRYATLGFSDRANLDDGPMWPTTFGLKKLTGTELAAIGELVKKAVS